METRIPDLISSSLIPGRVPGTSLSQEQHDVLSGSESTGTFIKNLLKVELLQESLDHVRAGVGLGWVGSVRRCR